MWIRTQSPTAEDWTQISGFISETQCTANMKEKLDVWKAFSDAKFVGNSVTFTGNKTTVSCEGYRISDKLCVAESFPDVEFFFHVGGTLCFADEAADLSPVLGSRALRPNPHDPDKQGCQ